MGTKSTDATSRTAVAGAAVLCVLQDWALSYCEIRDLAHRTTRRIQLLGSCLAAALAAVLWRALRAPL